MPKKHKFGIKANAPGSEPYGVGLRAFRAPQLGWFLGRRNAEDEQVRAVLDGSTIAPTSVFSTRGDEILRRLRERTE